MKTSQSKKMLIQNLREKLSLSQQDLGKILGITRMAISNYESGNRFPNLEIAYQIIDIANKSGLKASLEDIYPRNLIEARKR
jgi:DNA-binding XRE family transcriptional regulator